ncbi:immunoglobulin-like domain-containing protein [Listeria booriae]|uniref:LPXTG cell wall anchor domain-containing protein n=1 Tax=Listeria booriae TaxID=1552123 RepID=UPI001E2D8B22|nr:immunoglobulin-like domain-containing protein [Listeria booriae]MCD2207455.1 DUF5011 domain-containing protein [Listeria booriae]
MKKIGIWITVSLLVIASLLPSQYAVKAETTDHKISNSVISTDGTSVTHTIEMALHKEKREKKLDLVIIQDLSGSFRSSYPQVNTRVQEALDLLNPYLDRTQFVGYTGIKASDANIPLATDPRAQLEKYNEGQISEGYNIILSNDLTDDVSKTKQIMNDVTTQNLFGNSTPTAYGIKKAMELYQAAAGPKTANRETLFLVVTDGFPNGDINGTPLTPSTSMVQLMGPTTGIVAALNQVNDAGYQTSFGLWQDATGIISEWGEATYRNYNNYINANIPNVVTRPEFFFNMLTSSSSIDDYAKYVRDIVQTNLNEQWSIEENIDPNYTYVPDSATIKDALTGNTITVPAPYTKPIITNNKLEWQLDALAEGDYILTYKVTSPITVNQKPTISAQNKTLFVGDTFQPLTGVTANDPEAGDITSGITVKENTVNTALPGVYKVVYEVTDSIANIPVLSGTVISDGKIMFQNKLDKTLSKLEYTQTLTPNTVTKEIEVTVLSKPVIQASDTTLFVGETFDALKDVTASDAKDGDISSSVTVKTSDVDTSEPGEYHVTYEVTNSANQTTTKTVTVTVLSKPIITAQDSTLYVGDAFDPLKDVSARDAKDGNITSSIIITENTVNTDVPGEYHVSYEVTNSIGETSTKTVTVTVLSKPVITAHDTTLFVGETFDPLKDVTASDAKDGTLTSDITVQANDVDTSTVGEYHVTYKVTNSVGETTTKTVTVTVLSKPIITAQDSTLYVGDTFDPLKDVTASDAKDGNITSSIAIKENTVNTNVPGEYRVTYEVTNSISETTTKTIKVTVLSKPVIVAQDTTLYVGETFDPLKDVSASDAKDGNITSSITIKENTVNTNVPGKYKVIYEVTNSVNEKTNKEVTVTVLSKPVIVAQDSSLYVGDTFNPLKDVAASDAKDGDITASVTVKANTVNTKIPGEYKVTYEVTNSVGETTTKTVKVTVLSKPVIIAQDSTIYVGDTFDATKNMSASDLKDGNITSSVTIKENTVNTKVPGDYKVTYEVTNSVGETTTKTVIVTVLSKPVITAQDSTLLVGDVFNPLKDVTASDLKDGDITSSVKVKENTVDTSKPGEYKVTYEVTNSVGETTTKVVTVTVFSQPVIVAQDTTLYVGDTFDILKGVSARDLKDGDITINVMVRESTVDTSKPGEYKVTYEVTNSVGETTTKTVKVTVLSKPTIVAEDTRLYVGDSFDPLKDMTANDAKDGDITSSVTIKENTVDTTKPGEYKVTYEVTNSVGETTTKTVKVTVLSKPVITAENTTLYVGDIFDVLKDVSADDLKDGDITASVTIKEKTVDTSRPGEYKVIYEVTNSVGETTTKTVIVTVLSKPVITAQDTTLYVGDTFDPIKGVAAEDAKDGDITAKLVILDNTVDTSKPGIYKVVYQVTNSVGETTIKEVQVTVLPVLTPEPTPANPITPTHPITPVKPVLPNVPSQQETGIAVHADPAAIKQYPAMTKENLPKTGDSTSFAPLFGGILLLAGLSILYRRKEH